ncbi:MAG: class I mannose-6-phosphate isomerase [Clostridia bacterium]|nr:class I mannose-6-phosphate isomerase [Clostridia bacterium]
MSISLNHPIKLRMATAWRTYTGGSKIRELHGEGGTEDNNFPEEWIMSTVRARNSGREDIVEGINMLEDEDISLAELIERDPVSALGREHSEKYGTSLGVLVKIIDSAERLTVQVHPTREKAMSLFNSRFGKTECWHIIGGREIDGEAPCIYFGFKEGVTRERWKECFDKQDIPAMLDCLHKFNVEAGETYLIEGGIPHAIGPGCLLIEIQEPTDYTIRTERTTPKGLAVADFMCHQGLGFDRMFDCFEYNGYSAEVVKERWGIKRRGDVIIDGDSTDMFGLSMTDVDGEVEILGSGRFSGVYILEGEGRLDGRAVSRGDQFFIPASCESFRLEGKMKLIRYSGPTR